MTWTHERRKRKKERKRKRKKERKRKRKKERKRKRKRKSEKNCKMGNLSMADWTVAWAQAAHALH